MIQYPRTPKGEDFKRVKNWSRTEPTQPPPPRIGRKYREDVVGGRDLISTRESYRGPSRVTSTGSEGQVEWKVIECEVCVCVYVCKVPKVWRPRTG